MNFIRIKWRKIMDNKRTFYKISYENNYVTIEFLEDEIHEIYGRLCNIYIAKNDYIIRKLSNVFIKLDEEILLKYSPDYEIYLQNVARILLDKDRTDRIMLKRNGNFGELRYDSVNKEVNKFSYDGDGEDTKEYRKEKTIELKDEQIDLIKNKKVFKILDKVIKSSIDIIDNKKGSLLIEYLNLESIELQKTLESYGDLCNISIITEDNKVFLYKNVFSNFEKELLIAENKDGLIYRNELANILLDLNRNNKIINEREGNFGIIIYNAIYRKCEKYVNSKQLENIKAIREMYNCNMEVEVLDIN
jgi:hypothetical protein